MTIKWSKKDCVEYSRQMRSKLEEINQVSNNGQKPLVSQLADKLRRTIGGRGTQV